MFKKLLSSSEFIVIAVSLLLTAITSSIIGIGGLFIAGNFTGVFFISFGVQVIAFFIINTFLQRRDDIINAKIVSEQLNALAKYSVQLPCAYCAKPNITGVILDQENKLNCEYCKQVSGVKMQFFTAQITTPLSNIVIRDVSQDQESIN
jgi:hypothetical protein